MICCDCGEDKPESAFNARRRYCKFPCQAARNRAYVESQGPERTRQRSADWYERNREIRRQKRPVEQAALKLLVITQYGGSCACCGETEMIFLSIDHIDGGGNEHRREIGQGGLYHWLKRHGWPEGFQVLCHNCNWAKSHGGCPHNLDSVVDSTVPTDYAQSHSNTKGSTHV